MSNSAKGKIKSEEHLKNLAIARKNIIKKPLTEEHKRNIGISSLGRKHTEESKKKIGISKIGKPRSEETKKKVSESLKGNIPWNKGIKLGKNPEHSKRMKGHIPWNKGKFGYKINKLKKKKKISK